jgi:hypothetical protein
MHNRFLGLVRDAWWLLLVCVAAGGLFWIVIRPAVGIVTVLLCLVAFAYFAFMRYDDEGRDVGDR